MSLRREPNQAEPISLCKRTYLAMIYASVFFCAFALPTSILFFFFNFSPGGAMAIMGQATRDTHSCLLKVERGSVYVARRVSTHTTQDTLIHTRFRLCPSFVSRLMRTWTNMRWFSVLLYTAVAFAIVLFRIIRSDLLSKASLRYVCCSLQIVAIHEVVGV